MGEGQEEAPRRKPGRPARAGQKRRVEIYVRVTESEAEVLDELVRAEQQNSPLADVNRSTLIRGLLEKEARARGIEATPRQEGHGAHGS